jgi:hypothetical protein
VNLLIYGNNVWTRQKNWLFCVMSNKIYGFVAVVLYFVSFLQEFILNNAKYLLDATPPPILFGPDMGRAGVFRNSWHILYLLFSRNITMGRPIGSCLYVPVITCCPDGTIVGIWICNDLCKNVKYGETYPFEINWITCMFVEFIFIE